MIGVLRPHPPQSGSSDTDIGKGVRQIHGGSRANRKKSRNAPEQRYLAPEGYDDGARQPPAAADPDNDGVSATPSSPNLLGGGRPPRYILNELQLVDKWSKLGES